MYNNSSTQDISTIRWQNRIIMILSTEQSVELADVQIDRLLAEPEGLQERKIKVFHMTPSVSRQLYPSRKTLSANQYSQYHRPDESFEVLLIGLDGSKKMHITQLVDPQLIFDKIDSMPMRMAELRAKKDDGL